MCASFTEMEKDAALGLIMMARNSEASKLRYSQMAKMQQAILDLQADKTSRNAGLPPASQTA